MSIDLSHEKENAYLTKKERDSVKAFAHYGISDAVCFWQMTASNPNAVYACLNYGEAYCPKKIEKRAICIDGDTADVLGKLICNTQVIT